MRQPLSSDFWGLKGFWPGEPLWTTSVESTVTRRGIMPRIPVSVPGGVHRELQKTGVPPDPYFERNSLLCEWVERRWWCYRTFFTPPPAMDGRRAKLVFNGLTLEIGHVPRAQQLYFFRRPAVRTRRSKPCFICRKPACA